MPALLDELSRSDNPDGALVALDRFLGGLSGGARLISLLRQNPDFLSLSHPRSSEPRRGSPRSSRTIRR